VEPTPDALTDVENAVMSVVSEDAETMVEAAVELADEPIELDGIEEEPPHLAMIALVPSGGNIDRLAVEEGESPEHLHCTVLFLGESADIPDDVFAALVEEVVEAVREVEDPGPVVAEGFNVSLFNPHRDDRETCVVLGLSGTQLSALAQRIRERVFQRMESLSFALPEQHEPWIPHVTLQYTDDHNKVMEYADRTGDITFDRVRVALGGDVYDIDLEGDPMPEEEESDVEATVDTDALETASQNTTEAFAAVTPDDGTDEEIAEETVEVTSTEPGAWKGILVVEDVESGDGRMFAGGSLKTAPLPLPLMWQRQTEEGHKSSVQAGRIDDVWREGNQIWGSGVFDLEGEDGKEAYRQVSKKFLRGVSVDVDSVKNSDIEMIFPRMSGDEDDLEKLFADPDVTVFHHGRLRGATLVQFPAFVEASIALTGGDETEALAASMAPVLTASGPEDEEPDDAQLPDAALTIHEHQCGDNLTACACADQVVQAPDRSLFAYPNLTGPTPLTVDGIHVYGHAALKGTCHTGFAGQCVTMPREESHEYFLLGETLCSDGSTVATGTITLGTGHASTDGKVSAFDAIKHYDHTGTVVADIVTGEDEFGLWFSGALRSDLSPAKVRSLRAAKLSGDWRKFGNKLRLVALLAVNVPGFPVPRLRTAMHNGSQVALVAAGINPADGRTQEKQKSQESLRTVLTSLASRIGRDPETRMSELKSHVHGR
jgi:2'-5' RNA ligase